MIRRVSVLLAMASALQGQDTAPLFPEYVAAGKAVALRIPESVNRERGAWRVRLERGVLTIDGVPVSGTSTVARAYVRTIEWPGGGDRAVIALAGTRPQTIMVDAAAFARVAELIAPPAAADSADLAQLRAAGDSGTSARDLAALGQYAAAWGQPLRFTEFRGQRWVDLGTYVGSTTWNRFVVDGPARLAYFVRQELLAALQQRGAIQTTDGAAGVALRIGIASQDASWGLILSAFTTRKDETTFFLPLTAVNRFIAAEITDQELMDRSTVMLNGSRTKVDLSARWR